MPPDVVRELERIAVSLLTLSSAYPHASPELREAVRHLLAAAASATVSPEVKP